MLALAFHVGSMLVSIAFLWLVFSEIDPELDAAFLERHSPATPDLTRTDGDGLA